MTDERVDLRLRVTVPEAMFMRQAITCAIELAPDRFDAEQTETLLELERSLAEKIAATRTPPPCPRCGETSYPVLMDNGQMIYGHDCLPG